MDDNMQVEETQYMYMVHHRDAEGIQKHSGVFADVNRACALLFEWKQQADAFAARFIAKYNGDNNDYDIFILTAFPTDGTDGTTMYMAQGEAVPVDLLFTPQVDNAVIEDDTIVADDVPTQAEDGAHGNSEAGDIQDDL